MDQDNTHILQTQLDIYVSEGLYPFHMPGHKRRMEPAPGLPCTWDVTEVPGTDDLHDATGILREAMERTALQCGADRTWYLVNGSTCGLLAGIRALVRGGGEVLCARNCHKAVWHALELAGCRVHWIMPPVDPSWGICGGITAAQVEKALRRHPSVRALILTSPTYEGVLSDIKGICDVCHARNIPVLVDEAHGAHLMPVSARAGFPAGALACGADVVVQSPHKTLPSLTQTALLHMKGNLADPAGIEEQLDIFETSSPSYLLLASLDGCTGILREQGEQLFERWALRIGRFDETVRSLQKIRILHHTPAHETTAATASVTISGTAACTTSVSEAGTASGSIIGTTAGTDSGEKFSAYTTGGPELYDPGKIMIDASPVGLTGAGLASILRKKWKMETEMAEGNLLLAMTSLCDDEEALDRLAAALINIEAEVQTKGSVADLSSSTAPDLLKSDAAVRIRTALNALRPAAACSLSDASFQETEPVSLSDSVGRICAQYLYFYPPGIPFLAPGEIITSGILELIGAAGQAGETLYRKAAASHILCLRE